jgi:uncharacterized protein YecE (DUF72 family)
MSGNRGRVSPTSSPVHRDPAILVGTSGWSYDHWRGGFYPRGLASRGWLEHYASRLPTVELNATFYRLPSAHAVAHWREVAPPGFTFAVKMSRLVTHARRLRGVEGLVRSLAERLSPLGPALGACLVQLPPEFPVDAPLLDAFLKDLEAALAAQGRGASSGRVEIAVEFRDERWFVEDVYSVLRARRAAFCISDLAGREWPHVLTAPLVYVRLHGPSRAYSGSYSDEVLQRWAQACREWRRDGHTVRLYFDNDEAGYAAANAQHLLSLIETGDLSAGSGALQGG